MLFHFQVTENHVTSDIVDHMISANDGMHMQRISCIPPSIHVSVLKDTLCMLTLLIFI